ncbi:hypothetical protein JOC33_000614 [Thalassobacillus pellis]|nr:hypothetical protein [Thalassobacillus pellis]
MIAWLREPGFFYGKNFTEIFHHFIRFELIFIDLTVDYFAVCCLTP